ncbi:MAG: hypothetical protein MJE66_19685 [Proteobacteria bacterium]|nr:hypothetical protein [Pseudomonadota bacterium]
MGGRRRRARETGLAGPYWATLAYALLAGLCVVTAALALPRSPSPEAAVAAEPEAPPRARVTEQWDRAIRDLCRSPVLRQEGLEISCERGLISLPESIFFRADSSILKEDGKQRLRRAIPALLETLRKRFVLWPHLDAIEIRGHADPRAVRDPYTTNLVRSQERALEVLLFLTSDPGLPEEDRYDLRRLAVASGASSSRPPESCPEARSGCYPKWRRVEIRLLLDESALRDEVEALLRHGSERG